MTDFPAEHTASLNERFFQALAPGTRLVLVLSQDSIWETIDAREAEIVAVFPDRIVVTQTTPPVAEDTIGAEITVTLLSPDNTRLGSAARVRVLEAGYPIEADGISLPVIILDHPHGEVRPTNIRMYFRVSPAPFSEIRFLIPGFDGPVVLLDISLGGALISVPECFAMPEDRTIPFQLFLDDHGRDAIEGRARILNVKPSPREGDRAYGLGFVSLSNRHAGRLQLAINRQPRQSGASEIPEAGKGPHEPAGD